MKPNAEKVVVEESKRKSSSGHKYEIVSRVAYLIGVPEWVFENEFESPRLETFKELEKNKNARIIRNLCIVRAAIERWYPKISTKMHFEYRTLFSVPEYVPQEALEQLGFDGIHLNRQSGQKLTQRVIELNKLISDRINNCKSIFPEWLNWNYIRDLFIMKDGLSDEGVKLAGDTYQKSKECYPYKIYINWEPENNGNILYHDKKFVTLLYQRHKDKFLDLGKVSDEGQLAVGSIYDFVEQAGKVVMVVDCENTDPYRLCATLNVLTKQIQSKVHKIMLFDNADTIHLWRILESYTTIPVEYVTSQRVLQNKSLVDIEMTAITCREHYRGNVDSFILVSSDSDYWGLMSSLPEARFLVMVERGKSSPGLKATLSRNGIFFCFIEDFYDGNTDGIKSIALLNEVMHVLNDALRITVSELLEKALSATGIQMKNDEKKDFIDKNLGCMVISFDENGKLFVKLKEK